MQVKFLGFGDFKDEIKKSVSDEIKFFTDTYQQEVKKRTPIDTGKARRGWKKRTSSKSGEIRNRVPYIEKLEDGYSRQAPNGFVKQALTATLNKRKLK